MGIQVDFRVEVAKEVQVEKQPRSLLDHSRYSRGQDDWVNWPVSIPARERTEAAVYLSLSPAFFRLLVEQGIMPRPRMAGGRRIWDVEELDACFKALPRESNGEIDEDQNTWSDF